MTQLKFLKPMVFINLKNKIYLIIWQGSVKNKVKKKKMTNNFVFRNKTILFYIKKL